MVLNALILFLSVALPGLLVGRRAKLSEKKRSLFLVFAGAYLFAMTVIHLIPDLFLTEADPFSIGLWILLGFFLQKVLENFTSGVEHGHAHAHGSGITVTYLLIALSIHSFLEGSIMADSVHANHMPEIGHGDNGSLKILLGIVMHKIPAAIALVAMLTSLVKSKTKAMLLLLIFALASPLGLIVSEILSENEIVQADYLLIFFAVVAGSFLQISTTIFIESDPNHRLDWQKFGVSVLGAGMAVLAQLFI